MAKWISVQGTSSNCGKTVLTAAICEILRDKGYKVAPFKPLNFSLNSYPVDNMEIGYSTVFQSRKCGCNISKKLNPVLVKPMEEKAEIITNEYDQVSYESLEHYIEKKKSAIYESGRFLDQKYDVVVFEGFGSMIQSNLSTNINIEVMRKFNSQNYLVTDASRGGIASSVYGSLELIDNELKQNFHQIIINKLHEGSQNKKRMSDFIESKTGISTKIIYQKKNLNIPPEDGKPEFSGNGEIAIVDYPHSSNLTDFYKLPKEKTKFVTDPDQLDETKLLILPGTKNTIKDVKWLKQRSFAEKINKSNFNVLGICGGFQMMGGLIKGNKAEENKTEKGIGIFKMNTVFDKEKKTKSRTLKFKNSSIKGYEIHYGSTEFEEEYEKIFNTEDGKDGVLSNRFIGTYIHDCLNNPRFKKWVLDKSNISYKDDSQSGWEEFKDVVEKTITLPQ